MLQKKISFLTTGHDPFDDRIFYHMARSFSDNGWMAGIVSSRIDIHQIIEGISLNCFSGDLLPKREKISRMTDKLSEFNPDVVICSEPLALLAARNFSKNRQSKPRIIYDITEWYPSKKHLENTRFPSKWLIFIKLLSFNIIASPLADAFMFGEWYKSRPYRILFPRKPYIFIPYYPNARYINNIQPDLSGKELRLSFSGRISLEKGFGNFINAVKKLSKESKDLKIKIKIIGWYQTPDDKAECEKLISECGNKIAFSFYGKQSLPDFINLIHDSDIFLDLREMHFENNKCLPIKLFYYAALGRPVICSDLQAIKRDVEINKFGFAVDPKDDEKVVRIILQYMENRNMYLEHCSEARSLFETRYNWSAIEPRLLEFVNEISPV